MKKKTKTILSLLLIAALLGFNFAIIAKAEDDGGNVHSNGNTSSGSAASAATGQTAFNPRRIGYRIAYVDQDGNKIGHAYDLILQAEWTSGTRGNNAIYTLGGTVDKKIRQEYLGGISGSFSPNVAGIIGKNSAQLVTYGGQGSTSLPGKLGQIVNSALTAMTFKNGMERVFTGAFQYLKSNSTNAADFETAVNQVLALFGTSETYATLTQPSTRNPGQTVASERFIQFEPIFFTNESKCSGHITNGGETCSGGSWYDVRGVFGTAIEIAYSELAYQALSTAGVVYPEIGKRAPKPWCVGEGINCVVQNNRTTYDRDSIKNAAVATEVEFIYMGDIISQPTYDCTAIVDALKNQVKGSNPYLYKTLVERLRTASETSPFEAWLDMDGDGTDEKITVNTPQDFELMVESNYMDDQKNPYHDQSAHCAPATQIPDICSGTYPGTADLDDCVTGKTFYSDYPSEDAWLVCEIAFSDKGKHTSDNTNHITIQADTEPNLTMSNGTVVYGNTVGNNPYCKLFCIETFETDFPTSVYGVKAGQVFAWGSSSGTFGSVHIEKTCKNKELNESRGEGYLYKKWKRDYVNNERNLVKAYLKYAANRRYLDNIHYNYASIPASCSPNTNRRGRIISYTCNAHGDNITRAYTDTSYSNDHETGKYIGNQSQSSGTHASSCTLRTEDAAKRCAQKQTLEGYRSDMSTNNQLWKDRLQDEPAYLLYIRQCTKNLKYVYETVINLVFDEPVNDAYGANTRSFSSRDELDMDPPKDPLHETGYNTSNFIEGKSGCRWRNAYTYQCTYDSNPRNCKWTKLQVRDCKQVVWEIEGDWTYSFPAGIFEWYSYKVDGTVINETGQGINIPGKNQLSMADAYFYYIGYTLPTALSLTDGQYEMSVAVTNLGDNGTSNQGYNIPNGHFADLTGTNALGKSGFDYTCIYEVENEMFGYDCQYNASTLQGISPEFCDPSDDGDSEGYLNGVDVAYRVIQLLEDTDSINKSFPGLDGQGRTIGKNWQLSEEELHRILDARAIQSDQAMYEIMLDINAIQFIRRDNARYFSGASGANPYTSYVDYNGQQKIICVGDSSSRKYCASTFLDTLQNLNGGALTDDYILRGTCLPQGLTAEARANEILANGCGNSYTYPTINWAR